MASASVGWCRRRPRRGARAPVHMSFLVNGASGAARRATKFVRSARASAGVAISIKTNGALRQWRCCIRGLAFPPFLLQRWWIVSSGRQRVLRSSCILFAITFAPSSERVLIKDTACKKTPLNSNETYSERRWNLKNARHPSGT